MIVGAPDADDRPGKHEETQVFDKVVPRHSLLSCFIFRLSYRLTITILTII